jgi:hypothetical protein
MNHIIIIRILVQCLQLSQHVALAVRQTETRPPELIDASFIPTGRKGKSKAGAATICISYKCF